MAIFFAVFVAVIHSFIFYLESLAWGRPSTNRIFRMSEDEARTNRTFAFNQGFYNLFLAVGIVVGIALKFSGRTAEGGILLDFACLSVLGAGFVLFMSGPARRNPAMVQALPALGYLGFRFLGY